VLILYGFLLVLFVAGYAARYVRPELFWWGELIATGLPYLAAVVLVATVPVVLSRQPTLIAVQAVMLVLAAVRFGPGLWPRSSQAATGEDLSIVTFNVPTMYRDADGEALAALVDEAGAHLVAFQETRLVWSDQHESWSMTSTFLPLVRDQGFRMALRRPENRRQTLVPVLARIPIDSIDIIPLFHDPEGKIIEEVVRIRFRWEDREAVLYNLHLRSFGPGKPWESDVRWWNVDWWRYHLVRLREAYLARAREAEQVRDLIAAETVPVIVVGDFNSTPHNWAYAQIADGLRDAYAEAGEGGGATYHARWPLVRIDYVLASPAWTVVEAHVPEIQLSDHRPLVAHLRWRNEE
jgi:endonuclease/exonuclease/phosphatase (EEP) superfamily protein YafD